MSLIDLAAKDPDKFAGYTIEQIVSICGDGKLRDNSDAFKARGDDIRVSNIAII
jgi:hypothetical protein